MTLYHLIQGELDCAAIAEMQPKVPANTVDGEDKSLPRICMAKSLTECLTGIGVNIVGLKALRDQLVNSKPSLNTLAFPFVVCTFEVEETDDKLLVPQQIRQYVPDAHITGEHWYTAAIQPIKVEQMWLIDGSVYSERVTINNEQVRYAMFHGSKWSRTPQAAAKNFRNWILDITKQWLERS